jgi:hypothetical protein
MSYSTYDSYTTADGTTYRAIYKGDGKKSTGARSKGRNIVEKIDADGNRTVISSSYGGSSKSGNKNAVAATFDSFKEGLIKAEEGQNLTYTDDDIKTPSGGGFLSFSGDKASTLTLSDGTVLNSAAGNTSNEVKTLKRLADEIANLTSSTEGGEEGGEEGGDEGGDDEEEVTEEDLNEVGIDAKTYNAIITSPEAVTGTGGISGNYTIEPGYFPAPVTSDTAVGTGAVATTPSVTATSGQSGTYTTPAQTFESNVDNQVADLTSRAAMQQQLYQPQTIAENKAAGVDMSAYTITQKLYRNPNTGHQLYILFQGGKPMQQIPAGYVEVKASGEVTGGYNPLTAGGNTTTAANQGGYMSGFTGGGAAADPTNMSNIYGNVSFQDPVTGQIITQTGPEYLQSQANRAGQATFNPATMIAAPQTSVMTEATSPGTVLASTTGQALPTAPLITGSQLAQVSNISQAKGPGTPEITDAEGNVISEAVDTPTSVDASVQAAAPVIQTQLMGGTTTNYQSMADAVTGASWNPATGTFSLGGQNFTPDQFITANNLKVGDYMTTTGGFQPETLSRDTMKEVTGQTQLRQKVNEDGTPAIDAQGNPIMETFTSTSGLGAATQEKAKTVAEAQGEGVPLPTRTLDTTAGKSELIEGTGVDQGKVTGAFGTGEVQAASVQDELATLMSQFDDGQTPAWAAGAMRKANAIMSERGLGASSMAGQAVIQAAMEAALPIAQIDAGNKQQMALFKAEQRSKFLQIEFDQAFQRKVTNAARVSEIANINFSADQQVALENSRAAQTIDLTNLSNKQALIMAEAAALSQVDMANLNNLQQAAVQNAQNFLQIDMANLNNKQSTALFKAQSVTNAMLSDVAQVNANEQFNATSENQMTQFSSNLASQVSQFNAAQQNAINQFNTEEANAILEFNSALQNQREMFNSQNYLAVAQANAKWRQDITTANTTTQNVANLTYAKEVNGLTQKTLDDYWMKERDIMSYAFKQSESAMDRSVRILLGEQTLTALREKIEFANDQDKAAFWSRLVIGDMSLTDVFKFGKDKD